MASRMSSSVMLLRWSRSAMVLATFMILRYPLFDRSSLVAALSRMAFAFGFSWQSFFIVSAEMRAFSFSGMFE